MIHYLTAGQNLQAALDAAQAGDIVEIEAGAVYAGQFTLPAKTGRVTLRGAGIIKSALQSQPALKTAPGAHDWHLADLQIEALGHTGGAVADVLRLGANTQALEDVPRRLLLERVRINGKMRALRGITLNSAETIIRDCVVTEVVAQGFESQAICGWNTPGTILIERCHLEAGSIGCMFGGEVPSIPDLTPTGITFQDNVVTRPLAWRTLPYGCKNLFELKHASEVIVRRNQFSHSWNQGQQYAVALTPRASGAASWTKITQVRIVDNVFRSVAGGVNCLGTDTNNPSQYLDTVEISGNQFYDISTAYGGLGHFLLLTMSPRNIHVVGNIIHNQTGAFIYCGNTGATPVFPDGHRFQPSPGFRAEGNHVRSGDIRGDGRNGSASVVSTYLPEAVIVGNCLANDGAWSAENVFCSDAEFLARFQYPGELPDRRPGVG